MFPYLQLRDRITITEMFNNVPDSWPKAASHGAVHQQMRSLLAGCIDSTRVAEGAKPTVVCLDTLRVGRRAGCERPSGAEAVSIENLRNARRVLNNISALLFFRFYQISEPS
jgi:hypothetical protein